MQKSEMAKVGRLSDYFLPYLTLSECTFFLLGDNASESFPKGCYLCPSVKDETEIFPPIQNPAVDGDNSVV